MSDNTQIAASVALPERQDSRLSEEENQSSGSGSGAGYSADYESSESSLSSKQKTELQQVEEKSNRSNNKKDTASMDTGVKGKHKKRTKSGEQASGNKSVSSLDRTNEQLQALLPQWNGIRITHPMDPRIDLSTVGYTVNSNACAPPHSYMMAPHTAPHSSDNSNSIDHYLSLMEAVKPFFGAYTPVVNPLAGREPSSDQAPNTGSSEGFTAFFTTTNSNTGTSNTNASSDSNSDPNAIQNRQARVASQKDDDTETSVSSMVALARVKRKHKERHGQDGSAPSFSSGGEQKPHGENDESNGSAEKPLQQPQLGEIGETNQQQQQPQLQARRQDSSSSSSSEEQERQFPIPPPRQPLGNDIRADVNNVPLPLVSESSDARQSNGFSSQSNATASGSGSNGNSGVSNKGSSGSGSNNDGSSGSGNEEKGDACGGNSNSDENNKIKEPAIAVGEPMLGLEQEANDDGSTREDRLMDKKRKRLDMRREYELDMNTSSSDDQESSFVPGKPVTLDTALSFSRMARIVAQASPPFLVVHANAAFTRLTGIDSHEVNGRSISNLFTIPSKKDNGGGAQSHQAAAAAGRTRAQEETNVERLVSANGFDDYHIIQVAAKLQDVDDHNCDSLQCRMSISPIVAQSIPAEASAVVTDTNQVSHHHKKRKHHHHQEGQQNANHRHQKPPAATNPIITHYVIQLEPDDVNRSALTSDGSVLMRKLEQAQHHDQEMLDNEADLEETSHSTDPKEPVEAVG